MQVVKASASLCVSVQTHSFAKTFTTRTLKRDVVEGLGKNELVTPLDSCTCVFKHDYLPICDKSIGVAPITQLRMCVIKIVTFKRGHLIW